MPNAPEERREGPVPLLPAHPLGPERPHRHVRDRPDAVIAEAVFCHLLRQFTANQRHPMGYYLALQGHEPDAALLRRLQALAPGVQPRSHCRVSTRTGVTDRATGAAGVILEVTSMSWRHAAAVEVVGGYYTTPWHAAALWYHVEYDGARWIVTAARELWRV